MARGLTRGDVHLCQFAAPDKRRPVLILTRGAALEYLNTVTIAPITSTIRAVASEVALEEGDGMKGKCAVNLHNLVTVSRDRIGKRVGGLSERKLREVCAALKFALGC